MLMCPVFTHLCFRLVQVQMFCISRLAFVRLTFR